jgi:flagellar basal-body rod protein FlgC
MDFFTAMEVIASGLSAQRTRMNLVSENLAHANTTRTAEGGPYRRKDPILESRPLAARFEDVLAEHAAGAVQTVEVVGVAEDTEPPRLVHDPGHPDADANGYVAMPNVQIVEESVNLLMAARAYEAGVTALGTVKTMAERAISIGG